MGGLQRFELRLAGPALLRAVQRAASRPGAENYEKQHSGKHPSGLKAAAAAFEQTLKAGKTSEYSTYYTQLESEINAVLQSDNSVI